MTTDDRADDRDAQQRAMASALYADALRSARIVRAAARPLAWGLWHVNGDVVRAARYARVWLQEYAAEQLGLTRPALSRMESGQNYVSEGFARELARVFFGDEQRWRDFVDRSSDDELKARGTRGADPFMHVNSLRTPQQSAQSVRESVRARNQSETLDASA